MDRLPMGAAAMLLLIGSSCTGTIGDPRVGGTGGTTGTRSALCQGGGTPTPGPSYIRWVNRLEYNNTVRDLLGDTSAPALAFPAEEVSLGFDNNAQALSVSPVLAEQYMLAAEALATTAVTKRWSALVPCAATTTGAAAVDACGQAFITAFGQRAYRRTPDADDVAALTAAFNAGKATDLNTGIRLVIEVALQSPRFLYRVEFGAAPTGGATVAKLDDWEMASRLSYLLWHTMPDDALFAAATAGKLSAREDIAAQAQRMIADPRARDVAADFDSQWLRVDDIAGVEKDASVFPKYSRRHRGSSCSRRPSCSWTTSSGTGRGDSAVDLHRALHVRERHAGAVLRLYRRHGDTFVKTPLDGSRTAAGVLTQGGLLSLLAKAEPDIAGPSRQVRARAVVVHAAAAAARQSDDRAARAQRDADDAAALRAALGRSRPARLPPPDGSDRSRLRELRRRRRLPRDWRTASPIDDSGQVDGQRRRRAVPRRCASWRKAGVERAGAGLRRHASGSATATGAARPTPTRAAWRRSRPVRRGRLQGPRPARPRSRETDAFLYRQVTPPAAGGRAR